MSENQFVQHCNKRKFQILVPDELHGAAFFIIYVVAAAPCLIRFTACPMCSVLECRSTLAADYLARKAIPQLILMAALCHVLFRSVFVYQGSHCVKILLADYPLVMICHKIFVHLSVIHTAMKGLIGKCFLKYCAACVILIFQNS